MVCAEIYQIVIPPSNIEDQVVWHNSDDGNLTLKRAYAFLHPDNQIVPLGKKVLEAI